MKTKVDSVAYHIVRVFQRIALLYTALCTVIYWVVLLVFAILVEYSIQTVGHEFRDRQATQTAITAATNALLWQALYAGLAAVVLTLAMLAFARVRRYEKRMVIDGIVIAVFCAYTVAISQFAISYFIGHYLV